MKRRILGIALCVVLTTSLLFGCGGKSVTSDSTKTASKKQKTVATAEIRDVYITPSWVQSVIAGEQSDYMNYVIAEVGYGPVTDRESYNTNHIVGAQYIDIAEVEDTTGDAKGAYNLLAADVIERNILSHGITKDTKVILYGADPCGVARVAYAYLWAGVEDVKIINGGLVAWISAGYKTDTTQNQGTAAPSFGGTVPAHPEYLMSAKDVKEKTKKDKNFKLVSIRSEDEWLGKTSGYSYIDKAGEPEHAVWGKCSNTSSDVAQLVDEDGIVTDLDGLKNVWAGCGFTLDNQLAFYCGTGWRACVPFLILYENGYNNISVYDGGWYEWIMHSDYPVQVGDPASKECQHITVEKLPTGKASQ